MPESSPETAGVVVRPPFLYLGCLIVAWVLNYLFPWPIAPRLWDWRWLGGVVLFCLGLALFQWARNSFERVETPIPTNQPTKALALDGPYRYSRNPIYIALTIAYAGLGWTIGSWWPFVLLLVILPIMEFGVVRREERYLAARFGQEYLDYRKRVRRWF